MNLLGYDNFTKKFILISAKSKKLKVPKNYQLGKQNNVSTNNSKLTKKNVRKVHKGEVKKMRRKEHKHEGEKKKRGKSVQ